MGNKLQTVNQVLDLINSMIKEVESDVRYHEPPANVFINSPLALIQTDLSSRVSTLERLKHKIEGN